MSIFHNSAFIIEEDLAAGGDLAFLVFIYFFASLRILCVFAINLEFTEIICGLSNDLCNNAIMNYENKFRLFLSKRLERKNHSNFHNS